ncbi:zinc ribbon domain-containing protein [Anaerovorax odorimutans]|uniref:zinc ribbon domain-containing protein n=1 Tax=Anaerovorax odorimutans TaxID=109327 RepID=UPI000416AA1E|nr:zinc ribbon domain-containing protein [Anaerovorax odorimutans]
MSLKICPSCGSEIPENSKFCLECGEKIEVFKNDEIPEDDNIESKVEDNGISEIIEDYTEKECNLDFRTKLCTLVSNKINLIMVSILIIICILSGTYVINSSINYSKGIKSIKNGNYEEAVNYLEKSKNSKAEENIELAMDLAELDEKYKEGMKFYKNKDYESAYESLSLLNTSYPKYNESQKIIEEIKPILAQEYLTKAKDSYSKNYYLEAYDFIQKSLTYDSNQNEAKELKELYNKKYTEILNEKAEEKRKAEKEAAELERQKYEPQKIVDSNGKQIWKIYISNGKFHFTGTYEGSGNFIAKLSDSNQDLVEVIVNEIGDYVADKTVSVPYDGWYYLEIYGTDGKWTYNWN